MADISQATVIELMDALIAKANLHSHSLAIRGAMPLLVGLTAKDHISLGVLHGGARFMPSMTVGVKQGLPMGKYLVGVFIIPDREAEKSDIIVGAQNQ